MAKYTIEDTTLTNIASAIREKTGKSNLLLPSQMPSEIQSISGGGDTDYQLNADMKWAKQVCIDDVQEGYTYKVLEMISDGYVYHDIIVPSGGAVKTSDGGYYISNAKHTWDDTNARIPEYYQNMKLRWIITYYPEENTSAFSLYDDVIYVVIDGLKHSNKDFRNHYSLEYFEYINGGSYTGTSFSGTFSNCYSLQTIPQLNLNLANFIGSIFSSNSKLEFINLLNITKSINLSSSTKFSRETLVNGVLNNLVDLTGQTSQTLTLGSTNLNKLTEEDKLIAVNKNWILA